MRIPKSDVGGDSSGRAIPDNADGAPDCARLRKLKELPRCKKFGTDEEEPNWPKLRIVNGDLECVWSETASATPSRAMAKNKKGRLGCAKLLRVKREPKCKRSKANRDTLS